MVTDQYTITATQKYNFPQPAVDTTLPRRFIELSVNSLKQVRDQTIQLNSHSIQQFSNNAYQPQTAQLTQLPIPLKPKPQETTVAAVDTSTIKIGDTSRGIIVAVRGATVWRQTRKYRYTRLGPFIFHLTEENKKDLYSMLEQAYFAADTHASHASPPLQHMPMHIASLLEKWMQTMLAKTITDGILLFDGSLTAGTFDAPIQRVKSLLQASRNNNNVVIAFSKSTTLRFNGYLITDYRMMQPPPYIVEANGLRPKPPVILFGDVYVAKLDRLGYAFRVDIDNEVAFDRKVDAVEKLLGNDFFSQGYPETLRLSHILCTFTANEVVAMQRFIAYKYGIRLINRPDMHRLLFGLFGKGEDCA